MTLDRRNTLLFLGLTAGQGLTGCAALNIATRQPPRLFALSPKTTFEEGLPRSDAVVMVEAPSATAGLNTARIALKPEPTLLEYYAAALWIDVVPVMVQNLVVESLDASRAVEAVSPAEAVGIRPDYGLRIHIREFQAEYDQGTDKPPLVNVRLQGRLLEMPRRRSIDTVSVQQMLRASGTSVDSVVLAYDESLGKALKRLVEWTARTIDTAPASEQG
ncbi:MAG: membrane integrity-associated transporter subunit PqiC [Geminicoccaceae bacterium]|nr:membrane integrity-associated transporter subunit PqiC [Geminicoccaceae bacterium]